MVLATLPADGSRLYEAQYRGMRWLQARGFEPVLLPLVVPGGGDEGKGFRFLDSDGRVWAVRSDFTPLLARVVAADPEPRWPLRVCYAGEVARRGGPQLRGVGEFYQLGFESFGVRGEADTTVELLLNLGRVLGLELSQLVLTVGHTGVGEDMLCMLLEETPDPALVEMLAAKDVDGLCELVGLSEEAATYLRQAVLEEGEGWVRFFRQEEVWVRVQGAASVARKKGVRVHFELVPRTAAGYYRGVVFSLWGRKAKALLASGGEYAVEGKGQEVPAVGATLSLDRVLMEATC
ncbi:MAG: ATP phosphoribosyltransferase regulatory subunit [Thermoanaerobaculum sp.]